MYGRSSRAIITPPLCARMAAMRTLGLVVLLAVAGCGRSLPSPSAGTAANVECVPFARALSGVQIYGDAYTWWDAASGRYRRGADPAPGAVLVFRRTVRLPAGHVSVVSQVTGDREIRVTQANCVHDRITRNEPVVDVSPTHDWTAVRVWWAPANVLGATTYPTYGFVGPANAPTRPDLVADAAPP